MHRWFNGNGTSPTNNANLGVDGQSQIISDLYEALDSQPGSIEIQERIIEVWQDLGNEGNAKCLAFY
jgi:hypothetical protein